MNAVFQILTAIFSVAVVLMWFASLLLHSDSEKHKPYFNEPIANDDRLSQQIKSWFYLLTADRGIWTGLVIAVLSKSTIVMLLGLYVSLFMVHGD